jgi:hypothetical protein
MATHPAPSPPDEAIFSPSAAFLAWIWPGLGHISLGQKRRGMYIMLGMLFLIGCGVLVGGVDAVDRREDRLWFYAQAVCGPIVFGIDSINQRYIKGLPVEKQLHLKGLGKVNEIGILFIALAGLMNLIVILDALHHRPIVPPGDAAENPPRSGDPKSGTETGGEDGSDHAGPDVVRGRMSGSHSAGASGDDPGAASASVSVSGGGGGGGGRTT